MPTMSSMESLFCRSRGWNRYATRRVLPWALADAPTTGRALELGSGSGAMVERMLDQAPGLFITATDIDPRMVQALTPRLARFGDRVDVLQSDASRLPTAFTGTFDLVCSFLMLHHTLDIPAVLHEAGRTLRAGGRLVGYDLTDTASARVIHVVDRSPFDLATAAQMTTWLNGPAWQEAIVEKSAAGHLMRFSAVRSAAAVPAAAV